MPLFLANVGSYMAEILLGCNICTVLSIVLGSTVSISLEATIVPFTKVVPLFMSMVYIMRKVLLK